MFNTTHILYLLFSGLAGAALILALYFRKCERANRIALRVLPILTILIHYSILWVEYFANKGTATISSNMILLIYPCHVCMWLLFISSFLLDKKGPVARIIKDFTFWGGTVCGAIGTLFNFEFDNNPTLTDYGVLKGMLSHSTMVTGCILLFTAGYVSIRVWRGLCAVTAGLSLFCVCGFTVNALYAWFGLEPCNAMYLQEAPFENMVWIGTWSIGLLALAVVFAITAVFEQIALPKEERWYAKLAQFWRSRKNKA